MEFNPDSTVPLLVPVACPVDSRPDGAPKLSGKLKIKVYPNSLAYSIYRKREIEESFYCNFELNHAYQDKLEKAGLKISGISEDGGTRIIELPDRFFIGTGFVPQMSSEPSKPHSLIVAYLRAAMEKEKS
jgi:CTP synthase